MRETSGTNRNDDRLIRRYIDGQLNDSEFESFSERLLTDFSFRRRYILLAHLESATSDALTEDIVVPMRLKSQANWPWLSVTMATISLLIIAGLFLGRIVFQLDLPGENPGSNEPKLVEEKPKAFYPSPHKDQAAAIVLKVTGEPGGSLKTGQRLGAGTLKFEDGGILLEFICGARVALSGPTVLEIESKDQATLTTGQALTSVPHRARGFILNAPHAAVVDLGTEFSVSVDNKGVTDIAVTNGEIEWSILGEDGTTMTSSRLTEASAVRLNSRAGTSEQLPFHEPLELRQMQSLPEPALHVNAEYVQHVKSLKPEIYWRFEEADDQIIRSETGSVTGRIENNAADNSVSVQDGNIRFRRDFRQSRYLMTESPIEGLGRGPFSLEFWMRPDDIQHSTCAGLILDEEDFGRNHLSVVEIATDTFLVHEPAAVRFLVRSPPAHDYALGLNAFSPSVCTPGQWQHVVAVWDIGDIRLYFNGRLVRHLQSEQPLCDGQFHVILGQLRILPNTHRPYAGAMDEFALYRHALTDEDIRRHYELVASDNPDFTESVSFSETPP